MSPARSRNRRLYLGFRGVGGNQALGFASTSDGASWSSAFGNGGGSSSAPALAAFGGRLYAVWKGGGSDQRLFFSSSPNGS